MSFQTIKKWHTTNSAVWKSTKHVNADTYKLKYFDETQAKRTIKKTQNDLRKYKDMRKDMNRIYTKNDHKVYESTNWIYYFYGKINWRGEPVDVKKIQPWFFEIQRQNSSEKTGDFEQPYLIVKRHPKVRYFVSERLFQNRKKYFFIIPKTCRLYKT